MTKSIVPYSWLEFCPFCTGRLNLSNEFNDQPTTCSKCDYTEPSGNAKVITFISTAIIQYALSVNIDTVFNSGVKSDTQTCFSGNGLLPFFVRRAKTMIDAAGLDYIPGFQLGLKTVPDRKGLVGERIQMSGNAINVANTMFFMAEPIHEVMLLTQKLPGKFYPNQISMDAMPGYLHLIEPADSLEAKRQSALQNACQQMAVGARNGQG